MVQKKMKRLMAGLLCGVMIFTSGGMEQLVYAAQDTEMSETEEQVIPENIEDSGKEPDAENISEYAGADTEEYVDASEEKIQEEQTGAGDDKAGDAENTIILSDTWYALDSEGTLTISGDGMREHGIPWSLNKDDIKKVVLENGVTIIEAEAFRDCSNLISVEIPDSVTYMGYNVFYGCNSLTSIVIPKSVTYITSSVFEGCSSLINVELLGEITYIGRSAFSGCSSLASIELPDGLTSIESYAFKDCSSLESIKLPDKITTIKEYTFQGCTSLTNIELPDGMTNIELAAFWGCSSLTSITLPDGITSIGNSVFSGCNSLTSMTLPDGITSIRNSAFSGCNNLMSITLPDELTSIGDFAFKNCSSLTSIALPDGIMSIRSGTFSGCSSLTSIELPDELANIESYTFENCSSLTSIALPNGLTNIGGAAFENCSSLESIKLPDKITTISACTFQGCTSLTSIELPDGMTNIELAAFCGCSNLTSITLPDGLTSIVRGTFKNCSSLVSLELPNGLISIGNAAFENCNSLASIELPDGLTSIENSAFKNCSSLTSVELPDEITSIEPSAFENCSSLVSIELPNGLTNIGGAALENCSSLTSIALPGGITSIGSGTFKNCSSLTSVKLPDGMTSIEHLTFYSCSSLVSVEIPENITYIGGTAFDNCSSLTIYGYPGSKAQIFANTERIPFVSLSGSSFPNFYISSSITGAPGNTIVVSGKLTLGGEEEVSLDILKEEIEKITWTSSNEDAVQFAKCSVVKAADGYSGILSVSLRLYKEGISVIKGVTPSGYAAVCTVTVKSDKSGSVTLDLLNDDIKFKVYDLDNSSTFRRQPVSGADVMVDSIGSGTTDEKGELTIQNTLTDKPAINAKVSVKKQGYREYYFNRNIYHNQTTRLEGNNRIEVMLKTLQDKDATDPYVSTLMCQSFGSSYQDVMQSKVTYDISKQTESVKMQMNAVWHDKTPSEYILYQKGGQSHNSPDGNFLFDVTEAFIPDEPIYAKLVASDGTISEEETAIKIIETPILFATGNGATLVDTDSTGPLGENVAFLSGQNVSIKIKNVKINTFVERGQVRVTIGTSKKISEGDYLENEEWAEWKKLCECQPRDLNLSQWKNVLESVETDWTPSAKGETEVYGYAEGTVNKGGDTLVAGVMKLKTSLSAGVNAQYTIAFIPVYAKIAIGVDGSAEGKISFNLTQGKFDKDGTNITLSLEPYLSAEGGLGYNEALSLGAEGKGSMPFSTKVGGSNEDTTLSVKGALTLKATLLKFEESLTILENEWKLLPQSGARANTKAAGLSVLSVDDFTLSDNSYISRGSTWSGEDNLTDFTEKVLKTNIAPDAELQVIHTGSTKMLLWTESDPNRAYINSSKLVYSIYDKTSGKWSEPAAVKDDETADYAPSVVSDGEHIYVAWQNIAEKLNSNATLQDAANASTICMSTWRDGTFTEPIQISETGQMAVMPKIALNKEGKPYVAYVQNADKNLLLHTGQNDILYTVVADGSAAAPTMLAENAGFITSLDTEYTSDYEISYTLDQDGDRSTLEDREVITKGAKDSETQNDRMDSNVQYVQNGGQIFKIWYQDGSLLMSGASGENTVICQNETGSLTDNFQAVSSEQGELAVLWTAADKNGNKQIEGILYDAASDSWSRPVHLSDTDASIYNPEGIFTEDGKLQFFYKKTGNTQTDLCTLTVGLSVDLSLERAYCDETTFVPGKAAKVNVQLKNNGSKKADSYIIDVAGTKTEISESLAPGEEAIVEALYTVPDEISYQEIDITVETEGDSDPSNDTFKLGTGYTDLMASVTDNTYAFGQAIDICVANESHVDTEASLEVRRNSRDGKVLQSISLGTMEKGAVKSVQYMWNEETDGYSAHTSTLYFNVVSEKPEYFTNNNYDFAVVGDSVAAEKPPAEVTVTGLSAVKTKTEYIVGGFLNTDDLTVTASYSDKTEKTVDSFTTNANEIDMSTAGIRTLEITYTENGITVHTSVSLQIKPSSATVEPGIFTVVFEANGGTDLSENSRAVAEGETIGAFPSVKRDGYMFKGWYTEIDGGVQVTQDLAVTSDMILYAHWEAQVVTPGQPDDPSVTQTCKVTFNLQGKGSPLPEYAGYTQIHKGMNIQEPAAPKAAGYLFTGWYKDAECTVLWDFEKDAVKADMVLYAGWKIDYDYDGILEDDFPSDGNTQGLWIAGIKSYTYTGAAIRPDVRVYYNDKRLKQGRDYTVNYKNNKAAADTSGKKAPQIIVKGKGNYAGTLKAAFEIKKARLDASCLIASDSYLKGTAYTPAVMLGGNMLKAKTDYTLTYHQAEDDSLLKKRPTVTGSYVMRVVGKGSCEGTVDFQFTIAEEGAASISKGKASVGSMDYRGGYPEVSLSVGGEELVYGTHYTVRFSNTDRKGTATAFFIGIGNYTGTLKKTFKVNPIVLQAGDISIADQAVYEKGGAQPEITVTVGGTKLNEGTDYTVSYKGNTKVTKNAKAIIKGKGNYSYSRTVTFQVVPKDLNTEGIQIFVSDAALNKKPAITVFDTNGKKLASGSDYTAKVDKEAHTVTVTGGNNGLYTTDTPIGIAYEELDTDKVISSVSLNKKAEGFPRKFEYTENGVSLDKKWLTVKAGKYTLSSDEFEIIGYINNVKKGTAAVVIQGTGNYGGTKILNFKIQSRSLPSVKRWIVSLLGLEKSEDFVR